MKNGRVEGCWTLGSYLFAENPHERGCNIFLGQRGSSHVSANQLFSPFFERTLRLHHSSSFTHNLGTERLSKSGIFNSADSSPPSSVLRCTSSQKRKRKKQPPYSITPMSTPPFAESRIPHQRTIDGILFPTVVTPSPTALTSLSLFTSVVAADKPHLESLLRSSGALLLRGFPVRTAADFNAVVEAFGYEEFPYVGSAAPCTNVVGRVFTANESPPDQKIPFHHEMAQVPEFPGKVFFFCEQEPGSGGETLIVLSHHVYEMMKEKYPEFVERLEERGLVYTRVLGEGDDPSSPIGHGWHSTCMTKDRGVAEKRYEEDSPFNPTWRNVKKVRSPR